MLGVQARARRFQLAQRIAAVFEPLAAGWAGRGPGQTGVRAKGITGWVSGSVKGVTRLVGGAANAVLALAAPLPAGMAATTVAHNAGPLAPMQQVLSHKMVGDGLVPLESAWGQHKEPDPCLSVCAREPMDCARREPLGAVEAARGDAAVGAVAGGQTYS